MTLQFAHDLKCIDFIYLTVLWCFDTLSVVIFTLELFFTAEVKERGNEKKNLINHTWPAISIDNIVNPASIKSIYIITRRFQFGIFSFLIKSLSSFQHFFQLILFYVFMFFFFFLLGYLWFHQSKTHKISHFFPYEIYQSSNNDSVQHLDIKLNVNCLAFVCM